MKKFLSFGTLLLTLTGVCTWRAEAKTEQKGQKKPPENSMTTEVTPEARRNMAAMHQKMADCLKSDRPLQECRSEMMKSCQDMMGEGGCPMMGKVRHAKEHAGMMGSDVKEDMTQGKKE